MKYFDWDEEKNQKLKSERGIGFEEIINAIIDGNLIIILEHPRRANQKMYVLNIDKYAYVVPFVEEREKNFLKTIYPSRTMTKKYIMEVNK